MKSILIFQDSVEGTEYDFTRSVRVIKDYGMDPLSVIPALFDGDGNDLTTDIQDSLEYAFGEEIAAAACGYVTDSAAWDSMIGYYKSLGKDFPIVAAPSMLSETGDILVDESVYDSVIDNLLPVTKILVINHLEAELLAGFECKLPTDFSRAAKRIFNEYGCPSVIKACQDTSLRNIVFDGKKMDLFTNPSDKEIDCSLVSAIACEIASGKEMIEAVRSAYEKYFGAPVGDNNKQSVPKVVARPSVAAKPVEKKPDVAVASVKAPAVAPAATAAQPVKRSILTSGILSNSSNTMSLVSPAKSLRDIARSIDVPSSAAGSSVDGASSHEPAVTSSLKKESDNVRTLNELAELRARLNKLKESGSRTPAEDKNNIEATADL